MTWLLIIKLALLILWVCMWVSIAINTIVNNYFEKRTFLERFESKDSQA